jgi:hypothetical protein
LLQTFAAAFRHVRISGKVDRVMFSAVPIDVYQWPELRRQFEEQNEQYYKTVDGALDISEAALVECDIRKVRLVEVLCYQCLFSDSGSAYRGSNPWGQPNLLNANSSPQAGFRATKTKQTDPTAKRPCCQ